MAVFTSKITVTTTDGVVREHNYNDSTGEAADAKTDALFANILASVVAILGLSAPQSHSHWRLSCRPLRFLRRCTGGRGSTRTRQRSRLSEVDGAQRPRRRRGRLRTVTTPKVKQNGHHTMEVAPACGVADKYRRTTLAVDSLFEQPTGAVP